ncbi:UNVERIFIED_CONTAM: hypothetical protein GTU68_014741, partial [Idotea baltica]|nr:hypothetical protein [Idotea baltica]
MGWFKRLKDGIQTATKSKRDTPDGLWHKCRRCAELTTIKELRENMFICPKCDYHVRIGSHDYFDIIFDGKFNLLFEEIISKDILEFSDLKPYTERLVAAKKKTDLNDSISVAHGKCGRRDFVIAAMDFSFIGGSMGSVVGE